MGTHGGVEDGTPTPQGLREPPSTWCPPTGTDFAPLKGAVGTNGRDGDFGDVGRGVLRMGPPPHRGSGNPHPHGVPIGMDFTPLKGALGTHGGDGAFRDVRRGVRVEDGSPHPTGAQGTPIHAVPPHRDGLRPPKRGFRDTWGVLRMGPPPHRGSGTPHPRGDPIRIDFTPPKSSFGDAWRER